MAQMVVGGRDADIVAAGIQHVHAAPDGVREVEHVLDRAPVHHAGEPAMEG